MKRPLLALALAACTVVHAQETPIRLTIAAGKVGEVCLPLAAGDKLAWRFEASEAVDFNLHHHVGKDVLLPVDRKAVRTDRGEHAIDTRNDWCLMWTAPPGKRVSIEGAWSAQRAPK